MKTIVDKYLEDKSLAVASIKAYRNILYKFANYIKKHQITQFAYVDGVFIESYINTLENNSYSVNTINKHITVIRSFFNFLFQKGYIKKEVKINLLEKSCTDQKKVVLTASEFNSIVKLINPSKEYDLRNIIIMSLLFTTPLRLKEILGIKSNQISDHGDFLTVEKKTISLNKSIKEWIKKYQLQNKDTEMLLVNYKGNALSRQAVWKFLKKYNKELDLEKELSVELLNRSYKINKLLSEIQM